MSRPTDYSPEITARLCEELATGRSLRSVCNDEGMPDKATVFRWLALHPEFCDQYARAKEASADALVEDMLDIADETAFDTYQGADGESRTDTEAIQRSKLRVDTRKWIAARLKPKKYGDKIQQEHSGALSLTKTDLTDEQLAAIAAGSSAGTAEPSKGP